MKQRSTLMTDSKISRFDVAEYLTDETLINTYLNEALIDGVPSDFIEALNDVARAKGMNELALKTGIRRESLYKTLQSEKPRFDTMLKIIDGMGLQAIPDFKKPSLICGYSSISISTYTQEHAYIAIDLRSQWLLILIA